MSEDNKKGSRLKDHLIWFIWAVGYAFCFPIYNFNFLIWFIFTPVVVFAYRKPLRKTVTYAFFYSMVFWLMTLFWLIAFHEISLPFLVPGYSIYNAFFFLVIAYIAKRIPHLRFLVLPIVWTAGELLRSTGFVGFKWNLIGDTQWLNPYFLQSADIWGVWGVGFLILLVNSVLAEVVYLWIEERSLRDSLRRNRPLLIITASLIVINLVYGIIQYHRYERIAERSVKEKVALMQPNMGSFEPWWHTMWETYGKFWYLNAEAALYKPDLIVWSETMLRNRLWDLLRKLPPQHELYKFNMRFLKMPYEFNTPILLAHPEVWPDGTLGNTVDLIDPSQPTYQSYRKVHLTEFGEWLPGYEKIKPLSNMMANIGAGAYAPGKEFTVFHTKKGKFGVMICFEDVFALHARKLVRRGVNYFLNSTNDGWAYRFEVGGPFPLWQHIASAVSVAISVHRPIARAVNTGVTGVIHANGKLDISPVPIYQAGFYVTDVPVIDSKYQTIFVKIGFLFPYIVSLLALLGFTYAIFWGKDTI